MPVPSLRPSAAGRRGEHRSRSLPRLALVGLAALTFAGGISADRVLLTPGGASADSSVTSSPNFDIVQSTWDLIQTKWADPASVDDTALMYGAARGMVDALGDDGHSRFMDPDEAKQFREQNSGQFVGVGVEINLRGGLPVVVAPLDGSPALAAGVRSGDTILKVNGQSVEMKTIDEVGKMIRGEPGTDVTLTLLHRGDSMPYTITVTRKKLSIEPVTWRMLPGGIAQVRISDFTTGATMELKKALTAIREQGGRAVVLDLRDDPGGLVSELVGVASQFMPEGKVVFQQQERDQQPNEIRTVGRDGLWLDKPLVVLANNGSASAAEIASAALRDNGRATLLGDTTFGTGTVLVPFEQPDGSIVLLGTALWLTPDGAKIWKSGVVPDREIPMPYDQVPSRPSTDRDFTLADMAALKDDQLRAAWELAGRELAPSLTRPAAWPAPAGPDEATPASTSA